MAGLDEVRNVPRRAVGLGLAWARLPLTAYESVLRRGQDNSEWPPAIAFDGVEATVKQVAGSLFRDDELVEQGRLVRARVDQLRKAAELDAVAQQQRRDADTQLEQRRERAEQERRHVEERAENRKKQADEDRDKRQRDIDQATQQRRSQAREAKQAADKVVSRQDRAARATRVAEETRATAAERDAVRKQGDVLDLDQEIDRSKQARSSS